MYTLQIRVKEYNAGHMIRVWKDMRPSGGTAYTFETAEAAWQAAERHNDGRFTRDDYRVVDIARNAEV